jgi:hypothetical protein
LKEGSSDGTVIVTTDYTQVVEAKLVWDLEVTLNKKNIFIRDRSLFIPGVGTEEIWVGQSSF